MPARSFCVWVCGPISASLTPFFSGSTALVSPFFRSTGLWRAADSIDAWASSELIVPKGILVYSCTSSGSKRPASMSRVKERVTRSTRSCCFISPAAMASQACCIRPLPCKQANNNETVSSD